jgi:hypothetical protein
MEGQPVSALLCDLVAALEREVTQVKLHAERRAAERARESAGGGR